MIVTLMQQVTYSEVLRLFLIHCFIVPFHFIYYVYLVLLHALNYKQINKQHML